MFTMHSTLLVGQYDWDESRLPKAEFAERIGAFWESFADQDCAGIAVYGDRRNNAELAYFSHLVPKLQDAVMLLPRNGSPRLLVGGGKNAMPTAARQTWVAIEPLGDLIKAVAQWTADLKGKVAFVGDEYLRGPAHKGVSDAVGRGGLSAQAAATLRGLMQRKRPREIAALRDAVAALKAVAAALAGAQRSGSGVTDAIVKAEHAAHELGVAEVRSLFSADGGKTLRAFLTPIAKPADPLLAYFAVRHANYWADGFVTLASKPGAAQIKAGEILKALLPQIKAGAKGRDLCAFVRAQAQGWQPHPMIAGSLGNAIGLALEEAPLLGVDSDAPVQAGSVMSVRVGLTDGKGQNAIVSALVLVNALGNELLWSAV